MNEILLAVVMIAAAILIKFVITQQISKRSVRQVINSFENAGAIGRKNARSREELGLMQRRKTGGIIKRQDFKGNAVTTLINAGFIEVTEEGRLFVGEETYNNSSLSRYRGYG